MKKLLIILFCLTSFAAFSQQQFYLKKFPLNNSTQLHHQFADSTRHCFLLSNRFRHKQSGLFTFTILSSQTFNYLRKKLKLYNSKICFHNYVSQPGDFIYSFHFRRWHHLFLPPAARRTTGRKIL